MKKSKKNFVYIYIGVVLFLIVLGYRSYSYHQEIRKIEKTLESHLLTGLTLENPDVTVDIVSPKDASQEKPIMNVWIIVKNGEQIIVEGAAEIIENLDGSYAVLNYHSKRELETNPAILDDVYTEMAEKEIKEKYLK